jgi:hypothetical protein
MTSLNAFDLEARYHIYDICMKRGQPPLIGELSTLLSAPTEQVREALANLAEAHMLVLQKDTGEILMANPFSAVPTGFLVETPKFVCYGNCIWDSLGIAAMLHQDVHIRTSCADCGHSLELKILDGEVRGDEGLIHFAIPARHWWDDIVFT